MHVVRPSASGRIASETKQHQQHQQAGTSNPSIQSSFPPAPPPPRRSIDHQAHLALCRGRPGTPLSAPLFPVTPCWPTALWPPSARPPLSFLSRSLARFSPLLGRFRSSRPVASQKRGPSSALLWGSELPCFTLFCGAWDVQG